MIIELRDKHKTIIDSTRLIMLSESQWSSSFRFMMDGSCWEVDYDKEKLERDEDYEKLKAALLDKYKPNHSAEESKQYNEFCQQLSNAVNPNCKFADAKLQTEQTQKNEYKMKGWPSFRCSIVEDKSK